ncbi:hypothetical protein IJ135_02435 [Candidatus Saccharibacteria bacterium]|nr:hypothetical protein [Candidatus Saccharibacteria bacterium]
MVSSKTTKTTRKIKTTKSISAIKATGATKSTKNTRSAKNIKTTKIIKPTKSKKPAAIRKPQKYTGSLRETFEAYLHTNLTLAKYQKVGILFLIVVISGCFGWLYEFVFNIINKGEVLMQGGNLLPWMNIYAIGALFVIPLTYKLREYPWAVFVVSAITTGTVELVGGWLVYTIGNGTRYWDYNNEWWNFGNIGGFVCLLSVLAFGVLSMILMYGALPLCIHLAKRMNRRAFLILTTTLFVIIMADEITNLTLKNLNLPTAMDFYQSLGLKYY